MICVVALNPALDVTHFVAGADWSGVNRPLDVQERPGGKGLNVAWTLRALGRDVTVVGLAGGPAGQEMLARLHGTGIEVALTPIAGHTRRTFAVVDTAHGRTALFNEPGPDICEDEYRRFRVTYSACLASAAVVVLSGSLPSGVPDESYAGLIAMASSAGVPTVLDTSGAALRHGAAAGPTVVKPNLAELEAAVGRRLTRGDPLRAGARPLRSAPSGALGPDLAEVELAGRELMPSGAAFISLGEHGMLALADGTWLARPPSAVVGGNPTGAGDAAVAGLAAGLAAGRDWADLARHAAALGAAATAAPVAGELDVAEYERLVPAITIERLPDEVRATMEQDLCQR